MTGAPGPGIPEPPRPTGSAAERAALVIERVVKVLHEAGWVILLVLLLSLALTPLMLLPGVLNLPPPEAQGLDPKQFSQFTPEGLRFLNGFSLALLFGLEATLIGYTVARDRRRLAAWFRPSARSLLIGLGGGVAMFTIGIGGTLAVQALGIDVPDSASELLRVMPLPLVLLVVVILAPLGEELYFRGRLFEGLARWYGDPISALMTASFFAFVHFSLSLYPVFLLLGLVLAWLRRATGGLVAPVTAHFINNAAAFALTLWGPK